MTDDATPPRVRTYTADDLYLRLHGARERLCVASVALGQLTDGEDTACGERLSRAINEIDAVGTAHCEAWSKFDRTHEPADPHGPGPAEASAHLLEPHRSGPYDLGSLDPAWRWPLAAVVVTFLVCVTVLMGFGW